MAIRETDFILSRPAQEERERMTHLMKIGKARLSSVYLMKCNNLYKIGYSDTPKARMEGLQIGNPYKLELLWEDKVPNYQQIEEGLHQKFRDRLIRGEWFKLKKKDVRFILSLV